MKGIPTSGLLVVSNMYTVFAWYGQLKFVACKWFNRLGLVNIVLIFSGIASFAYSFQFPTNQIGFKAIVDLKCLAN
jgi:uncharacterized protein (DUF486 family)